MDGCNTGTASLARSSNTIAHRPTLRSPPRAKYAAWLTSSPQDGDGPKTAPIELVLEHSVTTLCCAVDAGQGPTLSPLASGALTAEVEVKVAGQLGLGGRHGGQSWRRCPRRLLPVSEPAECGTGRTTCLRECVCVASTEERLLGSETAADRHPRVYIILQAPRRLVFPRRSG